MSVMATSAMPMTMGTSVAYTSREKLRPNQNTAIATRKMGSVARTACVKLTAVWPKLKLIVRKPRVQQTMRGHTGPSCA